MTTFAAEVAGVTSSDSDPVPVQNSESWSKVILNLRI